MSTLYKSGRNFGFKYPSGKTSGDAEDTLRVANFERDTIIRDDGSLNARKSYRRSRALSLTKVMSTAELSDGESVTLGGRKFSLDDVSEDSSFDIRSDVLDSNSALANRALSIKGYDTSLVRKVGMDDFELKVDSMGKISSNKAFNNLSVESELAHDDPMFSISNVKVSQYGRFITVFYNGMKKGHATIEGRFIYTAPVMKDYFSLFTSRVINDICVVSGHNTKQFISIGRSRLKDGMTVEFWATDSVGNPMVSGHLDVYREKGKFYVHAHSSETLIGAPLFCTRTNKLVGILYSQEFTRPFRCGVSPVLVPGIDITNKCRMM